MRRVILALAVAAASGACGADMSKNKASGAAAAVGFGVATAAVYRAATDECWAMCRHGQKCDHDSGLCVPLEPSAKPRASSAPPIELALDADAGPPSAPDPCRGLCFTGERCAVVAGVADCVGVDAGSSDEP